MKIGISTILAAIGLILVFLGFFSQSGIAPLAIGLIVLLGILDIVGILHIGKVESKGTRYLNGALTVITLLMILNGAGYLAGATSSTNMLAIDQQPQTLDGATQSATLKLNMRNLIGATYAGSGVVYALHPGVVTDRNDFMKKIADGNTADIAPNSMTLSSGVFSLAGYAGKIGDTVTFAGYLDSTPAAAEEKSFVFTATLTGMTAGSTPEWMISKPTYVWYEYPTLLYYNYADTAVTVYTEDEDVAIEKTLSFSMFPTNNGEQWVDADLWVEAPAASIGAIKSITITPDNGQAVTYSGIPAEVTSGENLFRAVPALTTATDTMYHVGKFPNSDADGGLVRTSTNQKGRMSVTVTYDHPASGDILFYFKTTQNSNALTSTGGHYDSPATNLMLNMTTDGTDAWT